MTVEQTITLAAASLLSGGRFTVDEAIQYASALTQEVERYCRESRTTRLLKEEFAEIEKGIKP
jgi:hypothetical protein